MSSFITKIKENKVGLLMICFVLFSTVVIGIYAIKNFGTRYIDQKIQEQLQRSGLTSFVHYESIHLDPFTLTPSLENVSLGHESAPWLRFARISFNGYPLKQPSLDVNFWIQKSPASSLSRDTRYWMQAAGIDTLLGKGSLLSQVNGSHVSFQFILNIKDLGILTISSKINRLDNNVSISELRTDLIASVAMGQPEGVFIIHGDTINISELDMSYEDTGLMAHLLPVAYIDQDLLLVAIQSKIQEIGLAKVDSNAANQVAKTLIDFLQASSHQSSSHPVSANQKLSLKMSPSTPLSLKELALMAHDESLYKNSNMKVSSQP